MRPTPKICNCYCLFESILIEKTVSAFHWFAGKENKDTFDIEDQIPGMHTPGESEHHIPGITHSSHQPPSGVIAGSVSLSSRKHSVYVKNSTKPAKVPRFVMY